MQKFPTSLCAKNLFLFSFLLFLTYSLQAQVGIGNTNPDPSSILDITSETQGILAPRMTTLQRNAIATPANSLLVFDTDENAYFYYDASTSEWVRINSSAETRDNYKLVKSAADLAPELAAGGGSLYLLDENTFYEINGTITLKAPSHLNNAYLAGLDASEDILVRTTGTMFAGTTGGSIRNITITGGGTVFSVAGTAAQSLLLQNTVIANMGGVGTISGFGIFFSNIVQYVGNAGGITYSNINNLLLSNQAWFVTNGGTYETFTGTFNLIQKVSGFSTVNTPHTALNVSTPGLTVGEGVLLSTVFSGTGTYVNRYATGSYPGYNFTNSWFVNCPGIPAEMDSSAAGDINFSVAVGSGQTTTFSGTGAGSRIKIAGNTTSNNLFRFERSGNNRIIYRGRKSRFFQVNASISFLGTIDNTTTFVLYIAKGSGVTTSVILDTKVYGRYTTGFFTSGNIVALPIVGTVELQYGEHIEIWAERLDGTANMNTVSLNVSVK